MLLAPQCLDSRGPECLRSGAVIGVLDVKCRSRSEAGHVARRAVGKVGRDRVDRLSGLAIYGHETDNCSGS